MGTIRNIFALLDENKELEYYRVDEKQKEA